MSVKLTKVTSSNIDAIGFDEYTDDESIGILIVQFINGAKFQYFDVPRQKFDAFLEAESKGKFYIANVMKEYEHEKLRKADKNIVTGESVKSKNPDALKPEIRIGTIDL